jgi:hypothetical protein
MSVLQIDGPLLVSSRCPHDYSGFASAIACAWSPCFFPVHCTPSRPHTFALQNVYRNAEAVDDELVQLLYGPSCHENALPTFVNVITSSNAGPRPQELMPDIK